MIATIVTFLLVGLVALVAIGVVLAIVGAVFGLALSLAAFLLFKVAPVVLIGYVILRFLSPRTSRLERLERKHQKWIQGG